ncbi:hypothetical protein NJ7G_1642 [Natrinema sp. J7-2]|nr:hypothetical protein NJ7G_1642 [Natrinema sp. J7-2]
MASGGTCLPFDLLRKNSFQLNSFDRTVVIPPSNQTDS